MTMTIVDGVTGGVVGHLDVPPGLLHAVGLAETDVLVPGKSSDGTYWSFADGAWSPKLRPILPLGAVPVGEAVAIVVPPYTSVEVDGGMPVRVDDGTAEIVPDHSGAYRIRIYGPMVVTTEAVINAY